MRHPGVHGQELIDGGLAEQVLCACGQMLRRIHAIGPGQVDAGITTKTPSSWYTAIMARRIPCSTRAAGR